jgi:hypothetical protein
MLMCTHFIHRDLHLGDKLTEHVSLTLGKAEPRRNTSNPNENRPPAQDGDVLCPSWQWWDNSQVISVGTWACWRTAVMRLNSTLCQWDSDCLKPSMVLIDLGTDGRAVSPAPSALWPLPQMPGKQHLSADLASPGGNKLSDHGGVGAWRQEVGLHIAPLSQPPQVVSRNLIHKRYFYSQVHMVTGTQMLRGKKCYFKK